MPKVTTMAVAENQSRSQKCTPSHFSLSKITFFNLFIQGKKPRSIQAPFLSFPFFSFPRGAGEACRQTKATPDPAAACIISRVTTAILVRPAGSAPQLTQHTISCCRTNFFSFLIEKKIHAHHDLMKKKHIRSAIAIRSLRWNGDLASGFT